MFWGSNLGRLICLKIFWMLPRFLVAPIQWMWVGSQCVVNHFYKETCEDGADERWIVLVAPWHLIMQLLQYATQW